MRAGAQDAIATVPMDKESLRKHLEIHAEAFYDFADRICTLSTGALALSITFRKDIVGNSPSGIWLLQFSWAALVVSLLCCTFYRFSKAKVHWELARHIASGASDGVTSPGLFFSICFRLGCFSFIAGIVSFVWFAGLNT